MWLKIDTEILENQKVADLSRALRTSPHAAAGHLFGMWSRVLKQRPDGIIADWTDWFIADSLGIAPKHSSTIRKTLLDAGILDADPLRVHDWIDYAGTYLVKKLGTTAKGKVELERIWAIYGRVYGDEKTRGKVSRSHSGLNETSNRPQAGLNPVSRLDEIRQYIPNARACDPPEAGYVPGVVEISAATTATEPIGLGANDTPKGLAWYWRNAKGPCLNSSDEISKVEIHFAELLGKGASPAQIRSEIASKDFRRTEAIWVFCKRLEANQKPKNGPQKTEQTAAERAAETRRRIAEEQNR